MNDLQQALTWTEDDLHLLVGQPESFRLEFKAGRMFANKNAALETISKEVSAFANAEGGVLVLGLTERRQERQNAADVLDGIDGSEVPTPWLQQAVEASISPAIAGVRFRTIPLTSSPGRVCILIVVPAGTTAHQAQDRRYYGHSEFEVKPLADHDIRLRMQRGRVRRVRLEVGRWLSWRSFRTADGMIGPSDWEQDTRIRYVHLVELGALSEEIDELNGQGVRDVCAAFDLRLVNEGELTVRDLHVEIRWKRDTGASLYVGPDQVDVAIEMPFGWSLPQGSRLLPGQSITIPGSSWALACHSPRFCTGVAVLHWTVFLDDASAIQGDIDLLVDTQLTDASIATT